MSPAICTKPATAAVTAAIARVWAEFGSRVREVRRQRRMTTVELARRAGISRTTVYSVERGEAVSIDAAVRIASSLALRLEFDLIDPRRRERVATRSSDPVHAAMGNFEASHFSSLGYPIGLDEPYQHFQFAGRADFLAWDLEVRALLHLENRTRFPNIQETAGSFSSKRAYLGRVLAERLAVKRWASETHVIVALWSSEVLHALRLRTPSFRALCPDSAQAFASWWSGAPPTAGRASTLVILDPLAAGRERRFIDLDSALTARPRYTGYAHAAMAMLERGRVRKRGSS